ncbi:hypothetical protein DFQ27_009448 [Actinomortierella ambigua]|uniref:Uncharacterized protein n=1 Tax=Actinomortierella ambigua TaxID=1343610 RepID=A0A9P6QIR9_9FUNG|nr:hypothetical protein DFQ27_009448 [Actinomortierella ambigua]
MPDSQSLRRTTSRSQTLSRKTHAPSLASKARSQTLPKKLVVFDDNARHIIDRIQQKGEKMGGVWAPEDDCDDDSDDDDDDDDDGSTCSNSIGPDDKSAIREKQTPSSAPPTKKNPLLGPKRKATVAPVKVPLQQAKAVSQAAQSTSPTRMYVKAGSQNGELSPSSICSPESRIYREYTCVHSRKKLDCLEKGASKVWVTERHTFRRVLIEAEASPGLWRRNELEALGTTTEEDDLQAAASALS